jgi:hypothetical protein
MAKGLSPLQRAILRVLSGSKGLISGDELMEALPEGVLSREPLEHRIAVNSLRRALYRLWQRGLIMRTAQPYSATEDGRVRYGWGLATEEVRAHNFHVKAGFIVSPACPLYGVHGFRVFSDAWWAGDKHVGTETGRIFAGIAAKERAKLVRVPGLKKALQALQADGAETGRRRRRLRGAA